MEVYKFKEGEIHYEYPNIIEGIKFMSNIKLFNSGSDEMEKLGLFIENVGPFIKKVDIKFGKKIIDSYEKTLLEFSLIKVYGELFREFTQVFAKDSGKK